jgi:hypothetical protein
MAANGYVLVMADALKRNWEDDDPAGAFPA